MEVINDNQMIQISLWWFLNENDKVILQTWKNWEFEYEIRLFRGTCCLRHAFSPIDFLIYRVISCSSSAYSILFVISNFRALRNIQPGYYLPFCEYSHFSEHFSSHFRHVGKIARALRTSNFVELSERISELFMFS